MENNKTAETRDVLIKDVNRLKENAVQIAQDVRDHAAAHVDDTKAMVRGAIASARENVMAHPMSLVGAGFALGLLLGMRFRR
jgi:ElaB/YqjD/DUF883 family membrane-anchored ribosome-binding protein